jgi:NADPH:quinone reductase-like Zn-dependent oxidoreductase
MSASTAVPDGVDDAAALLLVRSGQLALATLRASDLGSGEGVLVTAAAGGVGHLAVQLAVALGAGRVVAAVGSAAKAEFVRGLGAGEVITYDAETWGDPVDVVLDGVGGDVQPRVLDALAPMGRLVAYHGAGGPVDVNALRMHARTVIGFAMAHFAAHRRDSYDRNQQELWDHYAAGRLRPVVHAILPLERAAEAHRLVESRANLGKVLLTP